MFSNIQTFLIATLVVTPPLYINPSLVWLFEAGYTGGGKGAQKGGGGAGQKKQKKRHKEGV